MQSVKSNLRRIKMKSIVRLSICLLLLTIIFGAPKALAVDKVLFLDGDGDYEYRRLC
jgi:hypothetical protein